MSELKYYGLAAECKNTTNDSAIAMLVKAHVLLCRDCDLKPMAEMWIGIAKDRNWLTPEDENDINHILNSD